MAGLRAWPATLKGTQGTLPAYMAGQSQARNKRRRVVRLTVLAVPSRFIRSHINKRKKKPKVKPNSNSGHSLLLVRDSVVRPSMMQSRGARDLYGFLDGHFELIHGPRYLISVLYSKIPLSIINEFLL